MKIDAVFVQNKNREFYSFFFAFATWISRVRLVKLRQ